MATEQELNDRLQKIQGDALEQHRLHMGARKERHFREYVRIVLAKSGAIIASKSPSTASLTTVSQPNVPFELERDIFLRGKDRYWIETELLNNGQMPLFKVTTEQGLLDTSRLTSQTSCTSSLSRS